MKKKRPNHKKKFFKSKSKDESKEQKNIKPKKKFTTGRSKKSIKVPPVVENPTKKELSATGIRLNKYVANAGVCSRRQADELIKNGEVTVNGDVVLEMGFKVEWGDVVKYKNKVLNPEEKVYILINKPKNTITSTTDPQGRRTVMDLIKTAMSSRIYPVGRLDRNTTGLLLLTNDGELAQKLMHPSYKIRKVYHATLNKAFLRRDYERLLQGVELEEGIVPIDDAAYPNPDDKRQVGLEIHIGWNRVVRRTFEALGYEVVKLDRVMYSSLTKKNLPRTKWRYLTKREVVFLKHLTGKKK